MVLSPYNVYRQNSSVESDWRNAADCLGIHSNQPIDDVKAAVSSRIQAVVNAAMTNRHSLAHNLPRALANDPDFAEHVILNTCPQSIHYFGLLSKDPSFHVRMLPQFQTTLDQRLFRRASGLRQTSVPSAGDSGA